VVIINRLDDCKPYWGNVRLRGEGMAHKPHPLSVISRVTIHQCSPVVMGHNMGLTFSNDIAGIAKAQSLLPAVGSLAYTAGFLPSGDVEIGRPLSHCSPHALGRNEHGLGLVFVGSFEREAPTPEALNTGAEFVAHVCRELLLETEWIEGHSEIVGGSHRENNTCPGAKFSMSDFRGLVLGKLRNMSVVGLVRLGIIVCRCMPNRLGQIALCLALQAFALF